MWPYLAELETATGPFQIPTYGSMMVLAFTLAFLLVHRRARRIGLHPDRLVPIYVAAAVGGLLGAKILYVVAIEPVSKLLLASTWLSSGGFAFYGGLLGGAAGVFAVARIVELPGLKIADLLAPALVLGLGVGRLGCFFAGCCHGAPAPHDGAASQLLPGVLQGELWLEPHFPFLTTEFHAGVGRIHDVPLYPTQLWSATAGIAVAALLAFLWARRRFDGQIVALMLLLEPPLRFFIESFRADERGYAVTWPVSAAWADRLPPGFTAAGDEVGSAVMGLTTSQGLGLGMMVLGAALVIALRRRGVAPETPIDEDDF